MIRTLLLSCVVALAVSASVSPPADPVVAAQSPTKVVIELFYESLCPYCLEFMSKELHDLIQIPEIFDVVDFRLYPFGNGKIVNKGEQFGFTCQHGVSECLGNTIASCGLAQYPQNQSVPFAVCLHYSGNSWKKTGQMCAERFEMDWEKVEECVSGSQGQQIQYAVATKTKSTKLQGVPALYFNGVSESQFETDLRDNLLEYICSTFEGTPPIEACRQQ